MATNRIHRIAYVCLLSAFLALALVSFFAFGSQGAPMLKLSVVPAPLPLFPVSFIRPRKAFSSAQTPSRSNPGLL